MPSFNEYATTEDILADWNAESEEWTKVEVYTVANRDLVLHQSTFGRWFVDRRWLQDRASQFTFMSEAHAREVYDANCRLMDRKWWAAQPPPAGFGRF